MCKCYNFILRRIHVYYQAVLWICGVIDYSVRICRNKINSDRIICGYLGFSNLLSKQQLQKWELLPFQWFLSSCAPKKTNFHRADFWSQELSCSCFGWLSFWSLIGSHVCTKAVVVAGGSWAGMCVWGWWGIGKGWSWGCYLRAVSVLS